MNTVRAAEAHGAKFKKQGPRRWVVLDQVGNRMEDEVFESKWQAARVYCEIYDLKPTKKTDEHESNGQLP